MYYSTPVNRTRMYEYRPFKPVSPPDLMKGNFYGLAGQNWNIDPNTSYYLDMFMKNYGDMSGELSKYYSGLLSGLSGTGTDMYDVGTAGLGTYDVGTAGLGTYDVGEKGLGLYDSALLGKLGSRLTTNLENPNASLALGLAKDWITGQGESQKQALAEDIARRGMRGTGIADYQMAELNRGLGRTASDIYRQIAMETEQRAIQDAMALEQLKGQLYEESMKRALTNAALGLRAFEGAKGRELERAGLGLQAFEGAKGRELERADLGRQAYEDAMRRALMGRELGLKYGGAYGGYLNDMLNTLADMLQWSGQTEMSAQQQGFENLSNLSESEMKRMLQNYELGRTYAKEYYDWLREMGLIPKMPQLGTPIYHWSPLYGRGFGLFGNNRRGIPYGRGAF